MNTNYLLEIKDVQKVFGRTAVVNNVSLNIERGKFITFLGPSGCGKTTLLRMIAGFYNVDNGSIYLNGKRIDNLAPHMRKTPMVFQEYALFPHMTVYENIAYGLRIQKLSKGNIKIKVEEVLKLVNLSGMEQRYPNQLSGGQQQRVAIARALVNNTELLLLDEPLSNLDAKLRESVRVELRQIQKKLGITMIYVTHDQQEALSMSDMIVVMDKGVVQEYGTPYEIYHNPKTKFASEFIGTTNFISGKKVQKDNALGLIYNEHTIIGDNLVTEQQEITFSIRPESIRIVEEPDPKFVSIKCNITYSMFLGEKTRYFAVDYYGKEWIVDEFDSKSIIREGPGYLIIEKGKPHFVIE